MGVLLWMAWITPLNQSPEIRLHIRAPAPTPIMCILHHETLKMPDETLAIQITRDTTLVFHPSSKVGFNRVRLSVITRGRRFSRTYTWHLAPSPSVSLQPQKAMVHFPLPGRYSLRVFDVLGRIVHRAHLHVQKAGDRASFQLTPGVYFLEIRRIPYQWREKIVIF